MTLTIRNYGRAGDFELVSRFLVRHYQPGTRDGNWLQPTWEYMNFHPMLDRTSLKHIGICEDLGEVVGVVNYESSLGEAFFQQNPDYTHLRPVLLGFAEAWLSRENDSGSRSLRVYLNDFDLEFNALVASRGYQQVPAYSRPTAIYTIPESLPEITFPDGFRLKSLADDPDWIKVHRVMWRGFNHQGEPPTGDGEIEERRVMFNTPTARMDLKIVVEAPNGDFVSLCGMWYEPTNRYAYVEPLATDPAYRRLGLAKAAVLEGIRRCAEAGATVVYVGSDQPFYLALGFEAIYTTICWEKLLA